MKLLYTTDTQPTGQNPVMYAVKDADYFYFTHTTNLPMSELGIAELNPDNKALCLDLLATIGKLDADGKTKYHVVDGVLNINEGWEEYRHEQSELY